MNRLLFAVPALLAIMPLVAQAPAGGTVWKADDLKARGAALAPRVDAHHVATQALGNFGGYSAMVAHREGSGEAEWHDNAADIIVVESGGCTMILGGTIQGGQSTGPGETRGTSIDGGQSYQLAPGDIIHVPPKTPHQMMLPPGGNISYWVIKLPTR